jgi:alkylation response protein AidB-like acyl-CoA dehydrogenase
MRATGSETVLLEDVFVPEEAVVLRRPRGAYPPAWNVILTVAMPLIVSAYAGVAQAAAALARDYAREHARAAGQAADPARPYLLGELANALTTAQLAVDDMVRIADDLNFGATAETANAVLVRKTIAAKAVLATAEKGLETVGGSGLYRRLGLECLLRDLHGAQFHPLPEKWQLRFKGRLALGLDPAGQAAHG